MHAHTNTHTHAHPHPHIHTDRHTLRQTHTLTYIHTDTQTHRQRQTDRHTQIESPRKHTHKKRPTHEPRDPHTQTHFYVDKMQRGPLEQNGRLLFWHVRNALMIIDLTWPNQSSKVQLLLSPSLCSLLSSLLCLLTWRLFLNCIGSVWIIEQ